MNADPSLSSSDDSIISALTKVRLWETIRARGGLDAQMRSQPLSQGEEQLFCLARAIIRRSDGKGILVLDEATSNVDEETDRLMRGVVREEFGGYTIITIAHRMETILDSDLVAVLDGGRLVAFGPPKEIREFM